MPWTMAAFTVGALSLIGVPPAAGFVSKWFMLSSAAQGGNYLVLAVLAAQHAAECRLPAADRARGVLQAA